LAARRRAIRRGLFIYFDEAAIAVWLARDHVRNRAAQLLAGFDLWRRQHPTGFQHPGVPYTMLHGLSHVLMAEIALECGYPASALKERIYALTDPDRSGAVGHCGILI
jgi:hypothetical protein